MSNLDYDEETFKEKTKRKAGFLALIGTGLLSILHILSHVLPAIGVLGLSFGENYGLIYRILSNEYMQIAYIFFVGLSFYYIYRDHKHHKHEKELRKRIEEMERLLEESRGKK